MSVSAREPRSHLANLDYSVVQQCMHCGLCLPTCPTYDATKMERNSPRGRISLMRAIADGRLEPTKTFAEEMYFCLGCLACMTACPAGVNYAELFEHARAEAELSRGAEQSQTELRQSIHRAVAIHGAASLAVGWRCSAALSAMGLQKLLRCSGVLKLLPRRLQELEAMTPDIQPKFSSELIPPVSPPAARSDTGLRC